jgi:hypothetical protein
MYEEVYLPAISQKRYTALTVHSYVRYQVLTATSMMFRVVLWIILPCKMIIDNHFTRQYNPEDNSEQDI